MTAEWMRPWIRVSSEFVIWGEAMDTGPDWSDAARVQL
jgi:hypothetical protein